jgi:hypothetical protein
VIQPELSMLVIRTSGAEEGVSTATAMNFVTVGAASSVTTATASIETTVIRTDL